MRMVALIPAREGSKRIPGKNTKRLSGHPLIAYTVAAAQESGVFESVWICSDDDRIFDWVLKHTENSIHYWSRPQVLDSQPDIEWVREALMTVGAAHQSMPMRFAILRPTSPFRTAATIQRAFEQFRRTPDVDSLRAVEPVTQHPGKMWAWNGAGYPMTPLLSYARSDGTPWHSAPTQTLPAFYVQNASLEMAWTRTVTQLGSIAGKKVLPFFTEGYEGFDINTPDDWREAERLIAEGLVALPAVSLARV